MMRVNFNWRYALLIIGVAALAYLAMDFNSRMAALQRLSAQRDIVASEVASLKSTESALRTAIAYTSSDSAVPAWSYQDGNMVRPGDIPVVPLPAAEVTPVPTLAQQSSRIESPNWQLWLWLFFDPPPR